MNDPASYRLLFLAVALSALFWAGIAALLWWAA